MNALATAELHGQIDFTRQRDWLDPTQLDTRITMVGCGGIGSPTALALAKLGIAHMRLIDPDTVEPHNLPNQMFALDLLGSPKVDALAAMLRDFALVNVDAQQARVTTNGVIADNGGAAPRLSGVIVSGLDSMEARADLWTQLKHNIQVPLLVDARLGGELIVIYTVDPRDPEQIERYEETLHPGGESLPLPCTRKSIIDVGFIVASLIVRLVRRHLAGEDIEHTTYWDHAQLKAVSA